MNRLCKECKEPLKGRIDKVFCSDQCRSTFNNKSNGISSTYVRKINRILQKNRKILEILDPEGKINVSRKQLVEAGFNFNYCTHTLTTKNSKSYFFCYDYGYLAISDDIFLLVKELK